MISHQSICIVKIIFECALNAKFDVRDHVISTLRMQKLLVRWRRPHWIDFSCGLLMSLGIAILKVFFFLHEFVNQLRFFYLSNFKLLFFGVKLYDITAIKLATMVIVIFATTDGFGEINQWKRVRDGSIKYNRDLSINLCLRG